ncbi:glutamate synthase-related protein [Inmirania thermothiophila]|uniref:Glutamate synthase domain-containing protein 2 n=1 Tax=Inmirania thermothiophila TaxID=1750597 RepID=A0A3N1XZR7_9GAMM|nr:glutamate synthase-related protein [Inmirania thermothiophila]ROR32069.1 glutamate synthase domain-containing protein 2 [Inmirania thermothiophila]
MPRWIAVCALDDLEEDRGREVWVNRRPLALFLHRGRVHALEDRCPHREGQLSRGWVADGDAVCPLHCWNFDLETGISPYDLHDRVAVYPVAVRDGVVHVDADAVPPLPEAVFAGYQGRFRRWRQDARGHYEVRRLAKGMGPAVEAMGSPRAGGPAPAAGLDRFHLRAAQLARAPLLEDEPVSTEVVIGRGAARPLRLALPVYVSHMSFGALSREAKIALARGAAAAGTAIGSGEGGMLPEEREAAALYILEMASGYFGWNEASLARADAVEIKLGQSAKPGLGGELPAAKVTEEISAVRGIAPGTPAHSPARFPDIDGPEALRARIAWIRERTAGRIPVGIKLAANDPEDVRAALALEPDFITVDGYGGGTGAAPVDVRDHFGMPLVQILPVARELVDAHNAASARPVSLVATGGLCTPVDVIKALALGADACALATAALFAIGCEYYRACNSGECPVGIATQKPELRARLDIATASERLAAFLDGSRRRIETYLRVMGRRSVAELGPEDLIRIEA